MEGGGGREKRRRRGEEVPSLPSPSPFIPFFALVPVFSTELARNRLLRRLRKIEITWYRKNKIKTKKKGNKTTTTTTTTRMTTKPIPSHAHKEC